MTSNEQTATGVKWRAN